MPIRRPAQSATIAGSLVVIPVQSHNRSARHHPQPDLGKNAFPLATTTGSSSVWVPDSGGFTNANLTMPVAQVFNDLKSIPRPSTAVATKSQEEPTLLMFRRSTGWGKPRRLQEGSQLGLLQDAPVNLVKSGGNTCCLQY